MTTPCGALGQERLLDKKSDDEGVNVVGAECTAQMTKAGAEWTGGEACI